MRVRKICTICGTLKSMSDFSDSEEYPDKKTRECKACIGEIQFGEYNSKINNNQTTKTMATLKEKREAAEAAEKAKLNKEVNPLAPKKTAAPKVGDTTEEGLKVVGEKKEPGSRGRKKREDNRPVEQLDLETGTIVIATFPTIAEAAAAVGTNYQYLYDGLAGWTKSVAKFKWRYQGEEIYVRPVKSKSDAEKAFLDGDKKPVKKEVEGTVEEVEETVEEVEEEEIHDWEPEQEEDNSPE